MTGRLAAALGLVIGLCAGDVAAAAIEVPAGNRNAEQPSVPGASSRRTAALKTTYEAKYRKVYDLLKNDQQLRRKIMAVAARYRIDPLHMVGAIVGEHTYNVDAYDRLQTYYVKALSYLNSDFTFEHEGIAVTDFVNRSEFDQCKSSSDSNALWTCRENVWNRKFAGRTVDGVSYPRDRFSAVFFQPFYAGQTFGLGQINPLTALQMSDMVNRVSGHPKLDVRDPQGVYRTIMDPDLSLDYVAASIRSAIDAYADIAGYDISGNPGVTATLYNLGNPEARAAALKRENADRSAAGQSPRLPQENYYGWLVNDKLDELRPLF